MLQAATGFAVPVEHPARQDALTPPPAPPLVDAHGLTTEGTVCDARVTGSRSATAAAPKPPALSLMPSAFSSRRDIVAANELPVSVGVDTSFLNSLISEAAKRMGVPSRSPRSAWTSLGKVYYLVVY